MSSKSIILLILTIMIIGIGNNIIILDMDLFVKDNNEPYKNEKEINKNTKEIFYGEWKINKTIPLGTPSIYGSEDIEKIMNNKIIYKKEFFKFGDFTCNNPEYKKTIVSHDEITYMLRTTYNAMGIDTKEPPIMVEVYTNNNGICANFGDRFFIKNIDTLIVENSGLFLELKRIK